tara:strand:+ start:1128 stop:1391 length:264 start_codon:yes stop_codon:yes gene_type:complete
MASPKKKSLPDFSEMKGKDGRGYVPDYLRNNPEVSKWLMEIFKWKDSGELHTSLADISNELSEYSGVEITGDQISRAFRKWKKSGRL